MMQSEDQPALKAIDMLTAELWMMVFEQLGASPDETMRGSVYYEHSLRGTWNPTGIPLVSPTMRLISRQLGALAMPFVFARCILSPKLFDAKYDGDPALLRVKSLIREYSRCIVIWCDLPWPSVISLLVECRLLKDLEWTTYWKEIMHPEVGVGQLLIQRLSHVRLHLLSWITDPSSFDLVPALNLVSLCLHITQAGRFTELCNVLFASKNLRTLNLHGPVDISPQAGQFPPIEELSIHSFHYTPHAKHHVWDFSKLQYLEIMLPEIYMMLQEVPLQNMPKIRSLKLTYPEHPNDPNWADRGNDWRESVDKFLNDQTMPQLEDLAISCFRPHLLIPTLGKKARGLKYLKLVDTAPYPFPNNCTPDHIHALLGGCPRLQALEIDVPHLLLLLDSEFIFRLNFCRFQELKELFIAFKGSYSTIKEVDGYHSISDSEQVKYRGILRRAKMCIVRWKTGAPLRRLTLRAYDMHSFGSIEDGKLNIHWAWDSEGKERVEKTGTGSFNYPELDCLDD